MAFCTSATPVPSSAASHGRGEVALLEVVLLPRSGALEQFALLKHSSKNCDNSSGVEGVGAGEWYSTGRFLLTPDTCIPVDGNCLISFAFSDVS